MIKTVDTDDMYCWLEVMSKPVVIGAERAFWRLSGATSVLVYLELLTTSQKEQIEQEFIEKYLAETGV